MKRSSRVAVALTLATSLGLSGCAAIKGEKSLKESLPFISKKEKEPEPYPNPAKMAVTWTPDVILRTGSTPTRGFGGRVFFYDEKSRPVPVEGELAVQAIRTAEGQEPELKRYAFTPEQFTKHYSQSDLGASYSIWIPWDAAGGEETKITLVPSFKTKEGNIVQGTSSIVALPGKTDRKDPSFELPPMEAVTGAPGAYTGGAWSLGNLNTSGQRGLTTTTIPVRGNLQRQLQQPQRQLPPGAQRAEELLARLKQGQLQPSDLQPGAVPAAPQGVQTAAANGIGGPAAVSPASAQLPVSQPAPATRPASFPLPQAFNTNAR
ncbi:hypothetical protein [Roseimaritima ulvae]|nr:hypothetical protein [Roseimaritima ulvae]